MSDTKIKEILENSKTIAMIGVSSEKKGEDPKNLKRKPANVVMKYMQDFGYKVIPVNPFAKGEVINGETVVESLDNISEKIDIVDVFRPSKETPGFAKEAVKLGAKTLWLQYGIQNEEAKKISEEANIKYIENKCIKQEYQKLFTNLQETGNTEGASSSDFADSLPVFTPDMEYVLWLGCFARHGLDPNFNRSVENFTKILDTAGISYGVLKQEHCSGDPANRLGDKLTYTMLREHNMEQLAETKKVVTLCPHCAVNLGKEYEKYDTVNYTVEHHTQVVGRLIEEGKIKVQMGEKYRRLWHLFAF